MSFKIAQIYLIYYEKLLDHSLSEIRMMLIVPSPATVLKKVEGAGSECFLADGEG